MLAVDGPDDTDTGGGATLARWLGVAGTDIALVFPALDRFAAADLGVLGGPGQ